MRTRCIELVIAFWLAGACSPALAIADSGADPACRATIPIQGLDDPGSSLAIELRALGWRGGTLQCLPRDLSELQSDGTGFYSWLKMTLAALALLVASLASLRAPLRPRRAL